MAVSVTSYTYDASGNRTCKTIDGVMTAYVYDAANQLTSETTGGVTTTYTYDGRGNLLSKTEGSDTISYEWDTRNRLTKVTPPGASSVSYAYDAQDRRIQKSDAAGVTQYVWDEENLLQERDGSGQLSAYYTNAPGTWGNLISQRRSGSAPAKPSARFNAVRFGAARFNQPSSGIAGVSSFYGFDLQGSTRHLSDASGTITDSYTYSAYGEELSNSGSTTNPFRYDGQWGYYRDDSQRLYVQTRHYQPGQGRWMSRDPIGFQGGDWNLYRYVDNSPINFIDPMGMARVGGPNVVDAGGRGSIECSSWPGGPCELARFLNDHLDRKGRPAYGGVVCCNCKKISCYWGPSNERQGIKKCVIVHENHHHDDISCPPDGYDRPPFKDPKAADREELKSGKYGIECLIKERTSECNGLKGAAKTKCIKDYNRRICVNCRAARSIYGHYPEFHPECKKLKCQKLKWG